MQLAPPLRAVLAFLFPDACVSCGAGLDATRSVLCTACEAGWRLTAGAMELPVPPDAEAPGRPTTAHHAFMFDGVTRDLIHALKYGGRTGIARYLAAGSLPAVLSALGDSSSEAIVPVPLTPLKRRDRGFNQSELLAIHFSRLTGVPHVPALTRVRGGRSHAGSDRHARLQLEAGAFVPSVRTVPRSALLVDDVLTTGATMAAAARALRCAGAREVACFAVAATPGKAGVRPESG